MRERFSKTSLAKFLKRVAQAAQTAHNFDHGDGTSQIRRGLRKDINDLQMSLDSSQRKKLDELLKAMEDRAIDYGRWYMAASLTSEFDLPTNHRFLEEEP